MDQEELDRLKAIAETSRRKAQYLSECDKHDEAVFGSPSCLSPYLQRKIAKRLQEAEDAEASIRSIRERSSEQQPTADTNLRSPDSSKAHDGEETLATTPTIDPSSLRMSRLLSAQKESTDSTDRSTALPAPKKSFDYLKEANDGCDSFTALQSIPVSESDEFRSSASASASASSSAPLYRNPALTYLSDKSQRLSRITSSRAGSAQVEFDRSQHRIFSPLTQASALAPAPYEDSDDDSSTDDDSDDDDPVAKYVLRGMKQNSRDLKEVNRQVKRNFSQIRSEGKKTRSQITQMSTATGVALGSISTSTEIVKDDTSEIKVVVKSIQEHLQTLANQTRSAIVAPTDTAAMPPTVTAVAADNAAVNTTIGAAASTVVDRVDSSSPSKASHITVVADGAKEVLASAVTGGNSTARCSATPSASSSDTRIMTGQSNRPTTSVTIPTTAQNHGRASAKAKDGSRELALNSTSEKKEVPDAEDSIAEELSPLKFTCQVVSAKSDEKADPAGISNVVADDAADSLSCSATPSAALCDTTVHAKKSLSATLSLLGTVSAPSSQLVDSAATMASSNTIAATDDAAATGANSNETVVFSALSPRAVSATSSAISSNAIVVVSSSRPPVPAPVVSTASTSIGPFSTKAKENGSRMPTAAPIVPEKSEKRGLSTGSTNIRLSTNGSTDKLIALPFRSTKDPNLTVSLANQSLTSSVDLTGLSSSCKVAVTSMISSAGIADFTVPLTSYEHADGAVRSVTDLATTTETLAHPAIERKSPFTVAAAATSARTDSATSPGADAEEAGPPDTVENRRTNDENAGVVVMKSKQPPSTALTSLSNFSADWLHKQMRSKSIKELKGGLATAMEELEKVKLEADLNKIVGGLETIGKMFNSADGLGPRALLICLLENNESALQLLLSCYDCPRSTICLAASATMEQQLRMVHRSPRPMDMAGLRDVSRILVLVICAASKLCGKDLTFAREGAKILQMAALVCRDHNYLKGIDAIMLECSDTKGTKPKPIRRMIALSLAVHTVLKGSDPHASLVDVKKKGNNVADAVKTCIEHGNETVRDNGMAALATLAMSTEFKNLATAAFKRLSLPFRERVRRSGLRFE